MKVNSIKVLEFLQENASKDMTATDVAEALGMTKRFVDAVFSATIIREGLGAREKVEGKAVLRLNESGLAYKPVVEQE